MTYYTCMEEWCYPAESGREYIGDFDTLEEALREAGERCRTEVYNFARKTGCDPTPPEAFISGDGTKQGVCMTCKNGLDKWWHAVKVYRMEHGL